MNYIGDPNITTRRIKGGRGWYESQKICDNRSNSQSDVGPQVNESRQAASKTQGSQGNKFSCTASRKGADLLTHFRLLMTRNV